MAEYIDKKYLDRKFQIDMMCLWGGTMIDSKEIIDSLPTADVIERSKINKAIEEIETYLLEDSCGGEHEKGVQFALEILKRNIEK